MRQPTGWSESHFAGLALLIGEENSFCALKNDAFRVYLKNYTNDSKSTYYLPMKKTVKAWEDVGIYGRIIVPCTITYSIPKKRSTKK